MYLTASLSPCCLPQDTRQGDTPFFTRTDKRNEGRKQRIDSRQSARGDAGLVSDAARLKGRPPALVYSFIV
eukprot:6547566-Prymnesium_polylepis.1